jgi:phenylalanyl-tRNA synthetase beta chain
MNILIPHTWLLEHLDTAASPEEIQRLLSLSGPSVERIYQKEDEPVYDIEVTTNRVDSMSVRGIAREAAVILTQAGVPAQLKPAAIPGIPGPTTTELPLPRIKNNPELSKRLTCVVLADVKRTPTPDWMAKRLKQIDQNVHDAVIDITNYITHELGHPCHAFDYDKVMEQGGEIIVTEATAGEKFQTLDGLEFTTVGGEVVFKNGRGDIIDLPSIKGTANTSIDDSTKNVLLLLESIIAPKVRFASMTHAIRTVAAQLMEKNVDPNLAFEVLKKGTQLYQELCNAKVGSQVFDDFPKPPRMEAVIVKTETIRNYLGIELPQDTVTNILKSLECKVEWPDEHTVKVTPPTFRPDITIPADVVEELARIYGYHNLPSKLMDTPIPLTKPENSHFNTETRIKQFLADLDWQELYTYSMVSEEIALQSGFSLEEHLKLQNPLTDDRVYLRRSLIPSLQEVLSNNSDHHDLSIFEIANVYHPRKNDLPDEVLQLSLVSPLSYREVRGIVESLLQQFYISGMTVQPKDQRSADVMVNEEWVGSVQVIGQHVAVELELRELLPLAKSHPTYKPLPKAASLKEDLTFQFPETVQIGTVMAEVESIDPLISSIELTDIYNQNYSFTVVYTHPEHSLSSEDIAPVRKKIVAIVTEKHKGSLIGSV